VIGIVMAAYIGSIVNAIYKAWMDIMILKKVIIVNKVIGKNICLNFFFDFMI